MTTTDKQQLVLVEYPDGKGNHTLTLAEAEEKWEGESPEWIKNFMHDLQTKGTAYSRFATYKLIKT